MNIIDHLKTSLIGKEALIQYLTGSNNIKTIAFGIITDIEQSYDNEDYLGLYLYVENDKRAFKFSDDTYIINII